MTTPDESVEADSSDSSGRTALILTIATRERNLELMSEYLRSEGYEVETASTLERFDELLSDSDGVSVVVLDLDGFTPSVWERCERIKALGVPILVLAGRLPAAARERAQASGAHTTLEKPVRKAELRGTVKTLARAAG
ncbi:PleD family two-component system response regulator [Halobium salinum]|uniref:PleD family two-component system response regulator n=1 Tax=Halobium salinum TaxID=1364940 RepID=A0ABD5PCV3_9EURY|nr:response regulator [Halobium salinum]